GREGAPPLRIRLPGLVGAPPSSRGRARRGRPRSPLRRRGRPTGRRLARRHARAPPRRLAGPTRPRRRSDDETVGAAVVDETSTEHFHAHYGARTLTDRIRSALLLAGLGDHPTIDDLAPLDQFHTGGRQATKDLADRADVHAGQAVLDVGGGIGGPARTL